MERSNQLFLHKRLDLAKDYYDVPDLHRNRVIVACIRSTTVANIDFCVLYDQTSLRFE